MSSPNVNFNQFRGAAPARAACRAGFAHPRTARRWTAQTMPLSRPDLDAAAPATTALGVEMRGDARDGRRGIVTLKPSVNLVLEYRTTQKIEMTVSRQPIFRLRRAKKQIDNYP
jgi:hypothetical protein